MQFRGRDRAIPYIHPLFKIATSQSNGLRMKNVVELHALDMSRSPRVFAMELCCQFWSRDVRATGHKALGESSVNITVSSYDTTHLQENPQRLG